MLHIRGLVAMYVFSFIIYNALRIYENGLIIFSLCLGITTTNLALQFSFLLVRKVFVSKDLSRFDLSFGIRCCAKTIGWFRAWMAVTAGFF
jgi:hypothetical protein